MTHRHDGIACCWDCWASKPSHPGPACPDCPPVYPRAFLPALAFAVQGAVVHPRSDLCRPCLAQRVVAPADDAAAEPVCRGHLAEGRINDMLRDGQIKGWWT